MTALYRDRAAADAAVEKLKAYAQPQRLMILSCLFEGERTVSEIDTVTKIGQPALSQQLAELRRADMVKTRRVSKQVYYDLASDAVRLCVRSMEAIFGGAPEMMESVQMALQTRLPLEANAKPVAGAAAFARVG
jgi:DNA-binding transcriptional ArsR family regulator